MASAQMTRRGALAAVAAALGLTMAAGCSPAWLDTASELTERDLEVARSIGKPENEIEGMRERGSASDDVRGAEAAEDHLVARYGERFRAVGVEAGYDSSVFPSEVRVTLAVETGAAAGARCTAVYQLEGGPRWQDDYCCVRLGESFRGLAASAFSTGFGDLAEGELAWDAEVIASLYYADAADGPTIEPDISLGGASEILTMTFDVFASPTTSLTEEGLAERLGRAAEPFERAGVSLALRACRITTPVSDEGLSSDWAEGESTLGNYDWYCHVGVGTEGEF